MTFSSQSLRTHLRFAALALALVACNGNEQPAAGAEPPVVAGEAVKPITDLDAFAQKLEDLSVAGDIEGLSGLWATAAEFTGCTVSKAQKTSPGVYAEEQLDVFRKQAKKEMGKKQRGEAIFTNRRKLEKVSYQNGNLKGADCPITARSRVNVVVVPSSNKPMVLEHRFNAVLGSQGWRLYRYLPNRPDCTKAGGTKHVGCQKLLELRPELVTDSP